jgi:hypothetical protein
MTVQNTETQNNDKGNGNGELDLSQMTTEQFLEEVNNNASLAAQVRVAADDDPRFKRFFDEMNGVSTSATVPPQEGNADTTAGQEKSASSVSQGQAQGTDELTVTVKIKPDMLGTFLVNRTPEEAVIEALRGKKESDKYIGVLKENLQHANSQTADLRRQLSEATRKATAPQVQPQSQVPVQAANPQPPVETPKIDVEEIKNLDLFDPDNQKKFLNSFATLADELQRLRSTPAAPPQETPPVDSHKETSSSEQQNSDNAELQQSFNNNELLLMKELQYQFPELSTNRDLLDIDREVANAYASMDRLAGARTPNEGVSLFLAQTPQGEAFRAQCAQAGVKLPEEYDQWYKIMSIREQRINDLGAFAKKLSERRGEEVSLYDVMDTPNHSYVDYYRRTQMTNGAQTSPLQDAIERHRQSQNASVLPPGTVPEIPQDLSQTPAGVELWSEEMLNEFITRKPLPQYNPDEAVIFSNICKRLKFPVPLAIAEKLK